MNHIRNTVAAIATVAALSLVTSCGDIEPPTEGVGNAVPKQAPAPKGPVRDQVNRLDFGDGKATLPAKPKPTQDGNASRLDFGDNGRP